MSSTDVAVRDAELALIQSQQEDEFDQSDFQTPILKVGQALTREVQNEEAEAGEFINTLTSEGLGNKIEFIVSFYQKGRFASDPKTDRVYVAFTEDIPEAWADFVGEEFVGTPFSEYPDAEETYKERVNAKEIEWGHGPLISTTHNYTGHAVISAPEGSDEPDELQPVRLSLKRTDMPAVRKINTLKRASLRNKPFWDKVFELSTYKKEFAKGVSHLVQAKLGRDTDADERAAAVELAQAVVGGRVKANDDAVDAPSKPDAKGGIEV